MGSETGMVLVTIDYIDGLVNLDYIDRLVTI